MTAAINNQKRLTDGTFTFKANTASELVVEVQPLPNFDQEIVEPSGATFRTRDGLLHCTTGPAVIDPDGYRLYYVNDVQLVPPAGVDIDFELSGVDEDGRQHWTSTGTGNRTVIQNPDGSVERRRDGDLHSDGHPAVVDADGTEHWYLNDREVPNPIPRIPHESTAHDVTQRTGENWVFGADVKDIKSKVAAHIQHAVKCGVLPDLGVRYTVSVTGQKQLIPTLSVTIEMPKERLNMIDPADGFANMSYEAQDARRHVDRILASYNRSSRSPNIDEGREQFHEQTSLVAAKGAAF